MEDQPGEGAPGLHDIGADDQEGHMDQAIVGKSLEPLVSRQLSVVPGADGVGGFGQVRAVCQLNWSIS